MADQTRIRSMLRALKRAIRKPKASQFEVEAAEWSFYLSYLRQGMVVFDVGASVGELTLLFGRFVRESGQVHAFEASPATFERLRNLCQASGYQNLTLNCTAVSAEEGEVEFNFYPGEFHTWNTMARRPLEKYGIDVKPVKREKIPATTVDAYCRKRGIERIDLLKVDVEGAEFQVMQGARRMLEEKRVDCCAFEFGQTTFDMGNRPADIRTFLAGVGYRIQNIVSGDPVFPGGTSAEKARYAMHVAFPR